MSNIFLFSAQNETIWRCKERKCNVSVHTAGDKKAPTLRDVKDLPHNHPAQVAIALVCDPLPSTSTQEPRESASCITDEENLAKNKKMKPTKRRFSSDAGKCLPHQPKKQVQCTVYTVHSRFIYFGPRITFVTFQSPSGPYSDKSI